MTSEQVSFSIVICSYNRATSLAETLASIDACLLPVGRLVELVLIDNNSTDATARICSDFAGVSRIPFRRVPETRQGVSFARNRGIQEARGKVILFTDDDCRVNDHWLVTYAREFDENRVDCAFGRVYPDWRGTPPAWFSDELNAAYALLDYGDQRFLVTDAAHEFFGANFAMRKDLLSELGGFDVHLGRTEAKLLIGEETRVYHDLVRRGSKIAYNPSIEVRHVIEEGRKEKAYLLKYYRDSAESLVYISLLGPPQRRVLGIPFFLAKKFAVFYAKFVPRLLSLAVRLDGAGLFALRLNERRNWRMILLFLRTRFKRLDQ
jgi:glycosyltransferase involved in cell wall biosynthesis